MMILPKHEKYEMYYAVYPDGTHSADFYNLARAKDHTAVIAETERRELFRRVCIEAGKLTDAFK